MIGKQCSVTRIFAKKVQLVRFLYYLPILENGDLLSKLDFFQVLIPEGNKVFIFLFTVTYLYIQEVV